MSSSRDVRLQLYSHIGARIRERRAQVGLQQKKLAEVLGVTQQAVSKLESGKMVIAADTLWWIARTLNTSVGFYFDGLPGSPENGAAAIAETGDR